MGDDFLEHILSLGPLKDLGSDALVECIQLARVNPRSATTARFSKHLFHQSLRVPFDFDELTPEGLTEVVRFASEMGETDWLEAVSRTIVRRFRPDQKQYVTPELLAEFGTLAFELGHEKWLDRFFQKFFEQMLNDGRLGSGRHGTRYVLDLLPLLKSFRDTPWYHRVVEVILGDLGPRALDNVPPDVAIELLRASGGELAHRWLERVPLEQFDRGLLRSHRFTRVDLVRST